VPLTERLPQGVGLQRTWDSRAVWGVGPQAPSVRALREYRRAV